MIKDFKEVNKWDFLRELRNLKGSKKYKLLDLGFDKVRFGSVNSTICLFGQDFSLTIGEDRNALIVEKCENQNYIVYYFAERIPRLTVKMTIDAMSKEMAEALYEVDFYSPHQEKGDLKFCLDREVVKVCKVMYLDISVNFDDVKYLAENLTENFTSGDFT